MCTGDYCKVLSSGDLEYIERDPLKFATEELGIKFEVEYYFSDRCDSFFKDYIFVDSDGPIKQKIIDLINKEGIKGQEYTEMCDLLMKI
jgi:hypothetical protein